MMLPDTWLPTWTVMTAFRFPVVVTVASISPRSTRVVTYAGVGECRVYTKVAPASARTAPAATSQRVTGLFRVDGAVTISGKVAMPCHRHFVCRPNPTPLRRSAFGRFHFRDL